MGRKTRTGKFKKPVAPAKKDPQALPSAQELGITDKQWHEVNALHLAGKSKRLGRSINRYRDSIRILDGGQIESKRSKH